MSVAWKADVVVVVARWTSATEQCLRSVLEHGGAALHRLIVIENSPNSSTTSCMLQAMARQDSRLHVFPRTSVRSEVEAVNLALATREADAVLLRCDIEVTPGWLEELAHGAHRGPRIGCVSPLSDQDAYGALQLEEAPTSREPGDVASILEAASHLPRWTLVPLPGPACCYLRSEIIHAVGLLDTTFRTMEAAIADWALRAQVLGFLTRRANRSYVRRLDTVHLWSEEDAEDSSCRGPLAERHPHLEAELDAFEGTLERTVAYHAISFSQAGKLRVAYDLRALPREQVGTRTYAVSLARALAQAPDIDLTLLVRDPVQAAGLAGRVVTAENWKDDVAVIHRPSQVIDPRELELLYNSSAHLIVTYQDLIGYRIPLVFGSDAEFQTYRATSSLSLQGVQRILAYSECAADEIIQEFGISREDVSVVPLGVDSDWFSHREPGDRTLRRKLKLPPRYFFSVATDFPHKNLPSLLEAYAQFRTQWTQGPPPALALAGYPTGSRSGFYQQLINNTSDAGVIFLGPVSTDQLRVLYQHAEALIFPSLYEGFGLPPLEAMAAGTAVIAMPISSVPEVGGDGVLYAEDLSVGALARCMDRVAHDESLRDELRERGLARVKEFRWEKTARETVRAYQETVRRPSERSLEMRRRLRDGILSWSEAGSTFNQDGAAHGHHPVYADHPPGIRTAWRALNGAVHRRLLREMRRFRPALPRRTA
jgi:glycosyltransferase involved in cell wall biosynthesis